MKPFLFKLLTVFVISGTLFSCQKDGATGPAGPAGPAGPMGPQGVSGNANVITYTYSSQTFTGALNLLLTNMSQARIDSGIVLVYYNPSTEVSTAWYSCPGVGSGGSYNTRFFYYQTGTSPSVYTVAIRALTLSGGGYPSPLTFTKTKVVIIATAAIANGGRYGGSLPDLTDYLSVKKYFALNE